MVVEIGKVLMSYRNQEQIISEILSQNKKRRLLDVKLEDGKLLLTFSDKANYAMKTVVKQYSKKKYKSADECIQKFEEAECHHSLLGQMVWRVIEVIELPNTWLIFFERNFSFK